MVAEGVHEEERWGEIGSRRGKSQSKFVKRNKFEREIAKGIGRVLEVVNVKHYKVFLQSC